MKSWHRRILFLGLACAPLFSFSQDIDAHSPHGSDPISKQQRSAEKKKAKQRSKAEKDEAKLRKRAMKLQTKAVRKRMKKSRKKAEKWDQGK